MQNLQGNGHAVPSSSPSRHPNHSNHSSHSSHSSLSRQDTPPPPSGSTHPTAPRILGPMGSLGIPVRQAPGFQAMQSSAFDDDVRAQAHPLPARVQRQGIKRERKEARDEAPIERVTDKKAKAARPTIRQASDSEEPPPLELGPPAALTDAKSSPAIDTKAAPDRRVQAARDAMDIPSLVRLSGPAREEALAQRQAVLDAWAQDMARTERLARFDRFGHQLCLSTPATPEEAAAVDLSLLGARTVVRHMTALQRQAALRAACAVPVSVQDITGVHRRIRLISLYEAAGIDRSRVLIKIAATWEGIQAAAELEREGIHTNLTLLFAFCQAVACGQAGVKLISPFVGRIYDWHKKAAGAQWVEAEHTGAQDPGVQSVRAIYNHYKKHGIATEVMGASFRNTGQILALAGCDLLTISPELLAQLAEGTAPVPRMLDAEAARAMDLPEVHYTEAQFRLALNEDAMATEKLAEGIRAFCADALRLEALMRQA